MQETEQFCLEVSFVKLSNGGLSYQLLALLHSEKEPISQRYALKADCMELFCTPLQVVLMLSHHNELFQLEKGLPL